MAIGAVGEKLCPMNGNYGILFAEGVINTDNTIGSRGLADLSVSLLEDGTCRLSAVATDKSENIARKQDVVQIAIEPESSPAGLIPDNGNRPMHLDNSHTIEIEADGLLIRMSNEIKPLLLKMLMDTLKESLC